jgi:hypothetical protein
MMEETEDVWKRRSNKSFPGKLKTQRSPSEQYEYSESQSVIESASFDWQEPRTRRTKMHQQEAKE